MVTFIKRGSRDLVAKREDVQTVLELTIYFPSGHQTNQTSFAFYIVMKMTQTTIVLESIGFCPRDGPSHICNRADHHFVSSFRPLMHQDR